MLDGKNCLGESLGGGSTGRPCGGNLFVGCVEEALWGTAVWGRLCEEKLRGGGCVGKAVWGKAEWERLCG